MLRLITAAVLVSVCLAYPQKKEGTPADQPNLQGFAPGFQPMLNMQPMQGMPGQQLLPFNPGFGYKRAFENLHERRPHAKFSDNKSPFGSEDGLDKFMNFMKENDKLPFANMDGAPADLGSFEQGAENDQQDGKFRFFDKQQ
nr:TPA_inf: conotoxin precursor B2 [Conus ebraeus]